MSTYRQHIKLLRNRNYAYLLLSSLLAALGNGLSYVALAWLVVRQHSSVSAVAVLMMCFWLPMVLFAPICGVISDRFHRLWLLIIASVVRALLYIALGIYCYYHYSLLMIYLFTFINGAFFSLYNPALFTFIRELVTKQDLLLANTQLDMTYEVGNVVGMGLAGFIMALLAASTVLVINGVFFALATVILIFIRYQPEEGAVLDKRAFSHVWSDLAQGLRYIVDSKSLYVLYLLQLLIFVEFMTSAILLAPYAKSVLHATAGQFGQIEAALSVGVIIGGIFNPNLAQRFGVYCILMIEIILCGLGFMLFSFVQHIYSAMALYFVIGLAFSAWPLVLTKAQELTKLSHQGRVQGAFNSVAGILILLVYIIANLFADIVPIYQLYWLEVAFSLTAALLLWRYRWLVRGVS